MKVYDPLETDENTMTAWSARAVKLGAEISAKAENTDRNSRWRRYAGVFWMSFFRGLGLFWGVLLGLTILGLHWRG